MYMEYEEFKQLGINKTEVFILSVFQYFGYT